jgi:glutaredoxin-like YruB-family protein
MIIKIYTTSTCHWCKVTKDYFKSKGVSYVEYDVESDGEKASEMVRKSGQRGVPVIDIDGKIIIGFNKEAIDKCIEK